MKNTHRLIFDSNNRLIIDSNIFPDEFSQTQTPASEAASFQVDQTH